MGSAPVNRPLPHDSTDAARRRGRLAFRVLKWVTIGVFVALPVYAIVSGFLDDPPPPPPLVFSLAALVPPAVLAVFWRPVHRTEESLFLTGASAFLIGLVGAGFGSVVAPVVGGLTIVALFFAPKGVPPEADA
jgi:hypothetical protein